MTPTEFGKLIKDDIHGVFLFYGEEQYLKQHYLSLLKKNISAGGENIISISGEDLSLSALSQQITDIASMPSFDMSKKLITVYDVEWDSINKEPEHDDDLDFFTDCLGELKQYDDVVVIIDTRPERFNAGTEKKPSALLAKLSQKLSPVSFAKETPAKLVGWIQKHFAAHKIAASPEVCSFIVNYCGRDMTTLNHEITKLSAYVLQNQRNDVKESDVRTVSSAVNEIETFDFSNALLNGKFERAFSILNDMRLHKEPPEMILGGIISTYNKLFTAKTLLEAGMLLPDIIQATGMREYQAKLYMQRAGRLSKKGLEKAVELCYEADTKIKSRNTDSYNTLDILLIKLSMTEKLR